MEDTSFYIEFVVKDSARFEVLQKVFNVLKDSKEKSSFKEDDFYLKFLMMRQSLILAGIQRKKILNGQINGLLHLLRKDGMIRAYRENGILVQ